MTTGSRGVRKSIEKFKLLSGKSLLRCAIYNFRSSVNDLAMNRYQGLTKFNCYIQNGAKIVLKIQQSIDYRTPVIIFKNSSIKQANFQNFGCLVEKIELHCEFRNKLRKGDSDNKVCMSIQKIEDFLKFTDKSS